MERKEVVLGGTKFRELCSETQIKIMIKRIAEKVQQYYQSQEIENIVALCILKGSFMFFSDLLKHLRLGIQVEFLKVSSYKGQTQGKLNVDLDIEEDKIIGKHILIIQDICDSGSTLQVIDMLLKAKKPASLKYITLVKRPVEPIISLLTYGLESSRFVVGYGMDINQWGRNLPQIYEKCQ